MAITHSETCCICYDSIIINNNIKKVEESSKYASGSNGLFFIALTWKDAESWMSKEWGLSGLADPETECIPNSEDCVMDIDFPGVYFGNIKLNNIDLIHKTCFAHPSVMMRRKFMINNPYPSTKSEDYALWLKLLRSGIKISGINKSLGSWRKNSLSLSSDTKQKIFDAFRLYYFYEKFNLFMSIYLTFRLSIFYLIKRFVQKKDLWVW